MKRVFLVDDHPILREGLARLLDQLPDCEVCGEAASTSEALEQITLLAPDLVVTDISLPDKSGLELLKDLRCLLPDTDVLIFSMHDEMLYAERSIKAGAKGYLMKGAKNPEVLEAVNRVINGGVYLSKKP